MPTKHRYRIDQGRAFLKINLLKSDVTYSIQEIKYWANQNWENYKSVIDRWQCTSCNTKKGIPCICINPDVQWKFLKQYEALDVLLRFHRKEDYFKQELLDYCNIEHSEIDLKIWTAKNEQLGSDEYMGFIRTYLGDYFVDETNQPPLRIYGDSETVLKIKNKIRKNRKLQGEKVNLDFEVFVEYQDFKNTIKFVEVFTELFWVRGILPESLKRIDDEIDEYEKQKRDEQIE